MFQESQESQCVSPSNISPCHVLKTPAETGFDDANPSDVDLSVVDWSNMELPSDSLLSGLDFENTSLWSPFELAVNRPVEDMNDNGDEAPQHTPKQGVRRDREAFEQDAPPLAEAPAAVQPRTTKKSRKRQATVQVWSLKQLRRWIGVTQVKLFEQQKTTERTLEFYCEATKESFMVNRAQCTVTMAGASVSIPSTIVGELAALAKPLKAVCRPQSVEPLPAKVVKNVLAFCGNPSKTVVIRELVLIGRAGASYYLESELETAKIPYERSFAQQQDMHDVHLVQALKDHRMLKKRDNKSSLVPSQVNGRKALHLDNWIVVMMEE